MKSALVVIDVQQALIEPEPKPYEAYEVIERINTASEWARRNDIPVIFIRHEAPDSIVERHSPGWQVHEKLIQAASDKYVNKNTPDSFNNTELKEVLDDLSIDHLYVCGYATEFCVDTTTRRAAGLGYPITLLADAHTTHDKPHASGAVIREHHNCTLPSIRSFGVKIESVKVETIIS
ncbi:isochorismatase hydrolase [Vibrio nigripulchritudo ATCC 27043]|uniref:cysteine hydrolase family protein n=1 Tax=Vibrio nigripulchritudo TaxID=28173 RepID=UPI00021C31B6|nr:cysteine hydrolase family protein [Vibrio nigripulchritudo]EGU56105.1 isochorismatase hydrolase [Vibrio nigripulchritudo ATCC 27043]